MVVSGSGGTVDVGLSMEGVGVVDLSADVPVEPPEEHETINMLTVSTMTGRRVPNRLMVVECNCQL